MSSNSLYIALTEYINANDVDFPKTTGIVSKKKVRTYIKSKGVHVNGKIVLEDKKSLFENDKISVGELSLIDLIFKDGNLSQESIIENENNGIKENHAPKKVMLKPIEQFSQIVYFSSIGTDLKTKLGLDKHESKMILENFINNNGLNNGLKLTKKEENYVDLLMSKLIQELFERKRHLGDISNGILNNNYTSFDRILQEYDRLSKSIGYKYVIAPLLPAAFQNKLFLQRIVKLINECNKKGKDHEKQKFYYDNRKVYEDYLDILDESKRDSLIVDELGHIRGIVEELLKQFKETARLEDKGAPKIILRTTNRNYNKIELGHQEFYVDVENCGDGVAQSVEIVNPGEENSIIEVIPEIVNMQPGQIMEVKLITQVPSNFEGELIINGSTIVKEIDNRILTNSFELKFEIENIIIPWSDIKRKNPYGSDSIDTKEKLFGRDEILGELVENVERDKLNSFKIWGQKRVGKTSIVKTYESEISKNSNILIANITASRSNNAEETFKELIDEVQDELRYQFDKIEDARIKEKLQKLPDVKSDNISFSGLKRFVKSILRTNKSLKIVIIIDEFDRLNDEFFLPGDIGESFSLGLGKGMKADSDGRLSIILVGAENMKLLDRQEINYNEFKDRKIDFFDKKTQYREFEKLVTEPLLPFVEYFPNAVSEIYEYSGGNPYFANLICENILTECIRNNESHINMDYVKKAINEIIDSGNKVHFTQYWDDGLLQENLISKDVKSDVRKRMLIAYNVAFNKTGKYPTEKMIFNNFSKPDEEGYDIENFQIQNTFKEFVQRNIFIPSKGNSNIRIRPKLFEEWLCKDRNKYLLSTGLADVQAKLDYDKKENELKLKEEELERIQHKLIFAGEIIPVDNYVSFLNQFGSFSNQRVIFNLMDSMVYVNSGEIRDFIRNQKKEFVEKKEHYLSENSRGINRKIQVYGFEDTIIDNSSFYKTFQTILGLSKNRKQKLISTFSASDVADVESVIILESCLVNLSDDKIKQLTNFSSKYAKLENPPKLLISSVILSKKSKRKIGRILENLDNIQFVSYKEMNESEINPFKNDSSLIDTKEEKELLLKVSRNVMPSISENQVAILFESHCPRVSLNIFWEELKLYKPLFLNDFKPVNIDATSSDSIGKNENIEKHDDIQTKLDDDIYNIELKFRDLIVEKLDPEENKSIKKVILDQQLQTKLLAGIDREIAQKPWLKKEHLIKTREALEFTDLMELLKIMQQKDHQEIFKEIFNNLSTLEQRFRQMAFFRNPKRHGRRTGSGEGFSSENNKIDDINIKDGEAAVLYFKRVFEGLN